MQVRFMEPQLRWRQVLVSPVQGGTTCSATVPQMPLPGLICTANEVSGRKGGESTGGAKRRQKERGQWDNLALSHPCPAAGSAQTPGQGGKSFLL